MQNVDLSLFKDFPISERFRVQFRAEFFNAFNHANFNNPSASVSTSSLASFGKSFSTVTDPREIQFAFEVVLSDAIHETYSGPQHRRGCARADAL